ncbi:GNAT family N-acetyltransferase [Rosistilla oblonga]|uniref:N-acetyltransferase domain-containing protein n=1 Tax=Rosistilla oblonga TaxID=2527990 RepID=A0A518IRU8_9BACT|nr:GNAT family N-acetyltransferase [Rosistilla oblonga]QDV55815.1 hypothetical protein Mal33_17940 [Rosistilla oblonga]
MNLPPEFSLTIQNHDDGWLPIEVVPYAESHAPWFSGVWKRMADGLAKSHALVNSPPPGWIQWKPWSWVHETKPGYERRNTLVALANSQVVGFINVWPDSPSGIDPSRNTLYIEHVAACPWNLTSQLWQRKYRHIGPALLAYAQWHSQSCGNDGNLSLHAADAAALDFYRKLESGRPQPLFTHKQTGILGPTPHGHHVDRKLTYLEIIANGGLELLEDYRNDKF